MTEQEALDVSPDSDTQQEQEQTTVRERSEQADPLADDEPDTEPVPASEVAVIDAGQLDVAHSNIGQIQLTEITPGVQIVTSLGYDPPPLPDPPAIDLAHIEARARLLAVGAQDGYQQTKEVASNAMRMLTAADMGFPPAWGLQNLYSFRDGQTPQLTGSGWLSVIERQPDMIMAWHQQTMDVCEATGYRLGRQPYHIELTYEDAEEAGWTKNKDGEGSDSTVWKRGINSRTHLEWAVAKIVGRKLLSDAVYAFGIMSLEDTTVLEAASQQVDAPKQTVEAREVTSGAGDVDHETAVNNAKWDIRALCGDNREKAREVWGKVVTDESDAEQIATAVARARKMLEAPFE